VRRWVGGVTMFSNGWLAVPCNILQGRWCETVGGVRMFFNGWLAVPCNILQGRGCETMGGGVERRCSVMVG